MLTYAADTVTIPGRQLLLANLTASVPTSSSSSLYLNPHPVCHCCLPSSPLLDSLFRGLVCNLILLSLLFSFSFLCFSPCSGLFCPGLRRGLPSALLVLSLPPPTSSLPLLSLSSAARNVATPPSRVRDLPPPVVNDPGRREALLPFTPGTGAVANPRCFLCDR